MNRIWPMAMFAAACLTATAAQKTTNPFAGRWDIDVKTANGTYPDWMELTEKDGTAEVRIQPRGGASHPAAAVSREGKKLLVTVSAAAANRPAVTWELTAEGDKLTGVQKRGDATDELRGVRAPALKRATPKAWTAPEPIFNGKDLTGWEPVNNPANSHWAVKDGELVNEARGSNIKTTRTFDDFKLHIEVNCPEHCNSGIYLRGRYEIQVGTEGGKQPSHEMGAIYGYVAPAKEMPMGNGEWQKFDITLVGRYVTVVRNGVVIHNRQEIPGITGGALDSREGEPGPFFLQGDHTGGLRYRNITVSVPKK